MVHVVQWFYSQGSTQCGPVDEEEFERLIQTGVVTRDTLVWKRGMSEWVAYGQLPGVTLPPPKVTSSGPGRVCVACSKTFPESETVELSGKHICAACKPMVLQQIREGIPIGTSGGLYRDGKYLIVERGAELPHRCVHCNAEGTWRKPRKYYWNPPWIWIFTLVCGLGVAIMAIVTRKRFETEVSLCAVHQKKRSQGILIAWLLFALTIVLSIVVSSAPISSEGSVIAGLSLFVTVLGAYVYGTWSASVLTTKRIGSRAARFSRACPAFLEKLPEWNREEL